ncbi:MAG TPA: type IX secretion system outer membrane channel protein PorV [Sphingobacteriaceae bacterium]|nr:type IX secretion system outer membrane channel protein PorV [Sphingobacteriaceae bacterium]
MRLNKLFLYYLTLGVFICSQGYGQTVAPGTQTDGKRSNNINSAVPFLLVSPDARSAAMGDAGAATSPDINSIHWNPAKLAYLENTTGAAISYTPWLRRVFSDVDLAYLTGYYRLDSRNTVGASLRYFSYGDIQLVDANQTDLGTYNPNEFAIDGTFSRKFGENFSLGTAVRYIRSSLSSGQFFSGQDRKPATALAADISGYVKNQTVLFGKDAEVAFGANISNIGTKMSYAQGGQKYFLPTNMKIGGATTLMIDDLSQFTVALDINKLLVPTSPERDASGKIIDGKDPDRSVPAGIFGSFADAPGGFSEEFHEVNYSLGAEYVYNKQFALRSGYFYEHPTKGNRQYLSVGLGLKYNIFNLDFAYLMANQQKSPLANTLRFSLVFNFPNSKPK